MSSYHYSLHFIKELGLECVMGFSQQKFIEVVFFSKVVLFQLLLMVEFNSESHIYA